MLRRARGTSWALPRLALAVLCGCSSTEVRACNEIVAISCGGCVLLSSEQVQDARELRALLARCGRCEPGMRCNLVASSPRCTPEPGEEGTPCGRWQSRNASKDLEFPCAPTLVCNAAFSPAQCAPPGRLRASCARDAECERGLFCSHGPPPHHCRPGQELDEVCEEIGCVDGLVCNAGLHPARCRPRAPTGAPCFVPSDCVEGLGCNGGVCAP
ncbi:MAG: hypothetical protein NVS3B10_08880 [Polyangiales bacterium]